MSVLRYCLTGLCTGVGTPLFGVLAVKLRSLPDTPSYHRSKRLWPVAFGLFLVCVNLIFGDLIYSVSVPRGLFVACVAAGGIIGILAVYLYRWRHISGK
jgi:hypothetical protein